MIYLCDFYLAKNNEYVVSFALVSLLNVLELHKLELGSREYQLFFCTA